MIILAIGDIMGRSGRDALLEFLPTLCGILSPDAVIVNAENSASGFGVTGKIIRLLMDAGVHAITLGNHAWDNNDGLEAIARNPCVVRPANASGMRDGRGHADIALPSGKTLRIINLSGRLSMAPEYDDPFAAIDRVIARSGHPVSQGFDAICVDMHAEATSEKMALGQYVDGLATVLWGTHTHVPTADTRILKGGTAFQSDLGMTGDYDSIIGMQTDITLCRMRGKMPRSRMQPAQGPGSVCGMVVKTDDATGLAIAAKPVRIGGVLPPCLPKGEDLF